MPGHHTQRRALLLALEMPKWPSCSSDKRTTTRDDHKMQPSKIDNSDCFDQYGLKDSSSGQVSGHPSLMNCKTLERIGSAFVYELICPAVTGLLDILSINKINSGGNGVDAGRSARGNLLNPSAFS